MATINQIHVLTDFVSKMRKQQNIKIIIHWPTTPLGWHKLVRHAVAVHELLEQDLAGTLVGPLSSHIHMLTPEDEEEALARYMRMCQKKRRK